MVAVAGAWLREDAMPPAGDARAHARRARAAARWLAAALLLSPAALSAHETDGVPTLSDAWSLSPWLLTPLALLTLLYVLGLLRLWRRAGTGRGVATREAAVGVLALAALLLATVWPLDAYGEWSLAAHMAQHMLLLALVPPLLLAARPLAVAACALPRAWAKPLQRPLARAHDATAAALAAATVAHSAAMWIWHLPAATALALAHEAAHWAMHASFLAAGIWFWTALRRRLRDPGSGAGGGVIALVTVMMQMGLLGALLTFAPRPLYPVYMARAPQLGLDPIADQQLAGLLMWVPSCLPYLLGGLWLLWRGFRHAERRTRGPMRP